MSDATSTHDFRVEKRGYHQDQVDARMRKLRSDRDTRWTRVAELDRRVEEAEAELAAVRRQAEDVVPEYDVLGSRAQRILALVEEQGNALLQEAEQAAEATDEAGQKDGEARLAEVGSEMAAFRESAEEQADGVLRLARAEAEGLLEEASEAARQERAAGEAEFEAARRDTAQMVVDFEENLARRREQQETTAARKESDLESRLASLNSRADEVLGRAQRDRDAAEARSAELISTSDREADEMLSEARTRAEQTRSRMERDQREHQRRADAIASHLDNIRQMLATLTGSVGTSAPAQEDQH